MKSVTSAYFELHSRKLYIDISKSYPSALFAVLQSTFLIHLLNGAQFLNATPIAQLDPATEISLLNKM